MFANASAKFMSNFSVNPSNLSLKTVKVNAPTEERTDTDADLADDEPPPKIEFEGAISNNGKYLFANIGKFISLINQFSRHTALFVQPFRIFLNIPPCRNSIIHKKTSIFVNFPILRAFRNLL
jgi:hypothetical protein